MKKQAIIILHGWGLSADKFDALKEEFISRGFDARALDMPGFGKSESPKRPFTLKDYADFLHSYIGRNSLVKPILVGHSFGGRVALKYQSMYPGGVGALILTGTPGYTPVSRKKLFLFIAFAKIGRAFTSILPFGSLRSTIRQWYYYVVGAREFNRAEGTMKETFKNIVRENLVAYMRMVDVPCALVWGELDTVTPLWIAKRMREVIPHSSLIIIPAADHGVVYKQPKVFALSVENFLKSL